MTPFPRSAFCALSASVLGMHPAYVTWQDRPEPTYNIPAAPYIWASMRIGASGRADVGTDDLVRTFNPDGTMTTTQVGRDVVTLGIELTSWASPMPEGQDADDLLTTYLATIWQPANLAQLNAMALVLETFNAVMPLRKVINGRRVSCARVDLRVALAAQQSWSDANGNMTVGRVIGAGTVTDGEATDTVNYDTGSSS